MQLRELDETTVKYLLVTNFVLLMQLENFKYDEEGKKTDVKDGIKVTIYSKERPKEFLNAKVNGTLNDLADFNIHDSSFENLTVTPGCKVSKSGICIN